MLQDRTQFYARRLVNDTNLASCHDVTIPDSSRPALTSQRQESIRMMHTLYSYVLAPLGYQMQRRDSGPTELMTILALSFRRVMPDGIRPSTRLRNRVEQRQSVSEPKTYPNSSSGWTIAGPRQKSDMHSVLCVCRLTLRKAHLPVHFGVKFTRNPGLIAGLTPTTTKPYVSDFACCPDACRFYFPRSILGRSLSLDSLSPRFDSTSWLYPTQTYIYAQPAFEADPSHGIGHMKAVFQHSGHEPHPPHTISSRRTIWVKPDSLDGFSSAPGRGSLPFALEKSLSSYAADWPEFFLNMHIKQNSSNSCSFNSTQKAKTYVAWTHRELEDHGLTFGFWHCSSAYYVSGRFARKGQFRDNDAQSSLTRKMEYPNAT
ncbi:hypothetical protein SODALDRAFT_354833 [Sodiomyces alkalinus F11]|uniref:Uncharacterized protein n=1 Tax=Sodiomyces alkalinus (strain CBS 110278 / VKM F-3762 / F11) TaxID=1314773 RepID=A0A3N2Q7B9_SODAK|nr:hypothetical protein SODALDRAFT_354833 [Sodiomyces alkalinus F11]ROT42669.1 hypothetical protein SODALDRAFT_354833 [Sodiomyces alkalinus F11]